LVIYEVLTGVKAWKEHGNQDIRTLLFKEKSPLCSNWRELVTKQELINLIENTVCYDIGRRWKMDKISGSSINFHEFHESSRTTKQPE
jgi:hypothetical protein